MSLDQSPEHFITGRNSPWTEKQQQDHNLHQLVRKRFFRSFIIITFQVKFVFSLSGCDFRQQSLLSNCKLSWHKSKNISVVCRNLHLYMTTERRTGEFSISRDRNSEQEDVRTTEKLIAEEKTLLNVQWCNRIKTTDCLSLSLSVRPALQSGADEASVQPSRRLRQTQTEAAHRLHQHGSSSR